MAFGVGGRAEGRKMLRDAENLIRDWQRPGMAEANPEGAAEARALARRLIVEGTRAGGYYRTEMVYTKIVPTKTRPRDMQYEDRLDDRDPDERPAVQAV